MNRIVFITGVSSGLGRGLAENYLHEGFEVYGVSRRSATELEGRPRGHFLPCDLSDFAAIPEKLHTLLGRLSRLDLVILNAGILGRIADLQETSIADIRKVMDVNVWANKVVLDSLYNLGLQIPQVVTISSGAATNANRGWNAYAISKAALNTLTSLYAAERPETHFSAIAPGIVDTPMQEQISDLPHDPRFSSLEMLRTARGTPIMPPPDEAAARLIEAIAKAVKYPSGSFLDINSLIKRSW